MSELAPCGAVTQTKDQLVATFIRFYNKPSDFSVYEIRCLMRQLANGHPYWHIDLTLINLLKYRDFNGLVEAFLKEDLAYVENFKSGPRRRKETRYRARVIADTCLTSLRILKYRIARARRVNPENARDILFSYPQLSVGGAERALIELVNFLHLSGKKVDLLLTSSNPLLLMKAKLQPGVRLLSHAEAMNCSYDYFVNYAHWISPRFISGIVRAKRRVQFIHNDIATVFEFFPRARFRREYKSVDLFVCVSEWVRHSFGLIYPDQATKARTIYNYYDQSMILETLAFPPVFYFNPGKMNIVTLARLHPAKGIDRAIHVADRLRNEGLDFTWHIIGDGPERTKLSEAIRDRKLEDIVILHGPVLNPFPEIKQASFMVIPSYYEGYGLVALEAKIAGIPVIASDYGPVRETIRDGIDGLVVPNSLDGMTEGIRRMLTDHELRTRLSSQGSSAIAYVSNRNSEIRNMLAEVFEPIKNA